VRADFHVRQQVHYFCVTEFIFTKIVVVRQKLKIFPVLNSTKIRQKVYWLMAGHEEADGHGLHTGCSFFSLRK